MTVTGPGRRSVCHSVPGSLCDLPLSRSASQWAPGPAGSYQNAAGGPRTAGL